MPTKAPILPPDDWTRRPTALPRQQALDEIAAQFHAAHPEAATPPRRGALPLVPHPSEFQADPPVIGGGGDLAREAKRVLDLDPVTKSRVDRVVLGPTQGSINWMDSQDLPLDTYGGNDPKGRSALSGVASLDLGAGGISTTRRAISLQEKDAPPSPGDRRERLQTLTHEVGHAAGMDEPAAEAVSRASRPIHEAVTPERALRAEMVKRALAADARTEAARRPLVPSTRGERALHWLFPSYPLVEPE